MTMAHITGHKAGKVYHKHVNFHIYESQYKTLVQNGQLDRELYENPVLVMPDKLETLDDLLDETKIHPKDFKIVGYKHHDPISYPFAV